MVGSQEHSGTTKLEEEGGTKLDCTKVELLKGQPNFKGQEQKWQGGVTLAEASKTSRKSCSVMLRLTFRTDKRVLSTSTSRSRTEGWVRVEGTEGWVRVEGTNVCSDMPSHANI